MSNLPDSFAGWSAFIVAVLVFMGVEKLAVRRGWIKSDEEVNPAWAYIRPRLIGAAAGLMIAFVWFTVLDHH